MIGTCPDCQHLVRLTPAGVLAAHLRDGVLITRVRHRRWRCPGSGRWPAAAIDRNREVVEQWVAAFGYVCPGVARLDHAPHVADPERNPLTAEHIDAVTLTHDERGELSVLCRSINSALGARLSRR
jgi:hypothetical protein